MAFLAGGSSHPSVLEAAGRVAALQLRLAAIRRSKVEVIRRFTKMAAKPSTAIQATGHEAGVHGIPFKNRRRRKAEVRIKTREGTEQSAAALGSAEDRVDPVYNGSSEHDERMWIFDELQNLDEYERKILSKRRKAGFALLRAFESIS